MKEKYGMSGITDIEENASTILFTIGPDACKRILKHPDEAWLVMTKAEYRSKKAKASRRKGSSNEGKVLKKLNKWLDSLPPQAGRFEKRGTGFKDADLISPPWFPFKVEIKKRETFTMDDLVVQRKSALWDWWEQTKRQATAKYKLPMLIAGKNFFPEIVFVNASGATWLQVKFDGCLLRVADVLRVAEDGLHESVRVYFLDDLLRFHPKIMMKGEKDVGDSGYEGKGEEGEATHQGTGEAPQGS